MGDARPEADVALAGVMDEGRRTDLPVGDAFETERGDDVESVATVGDVHRVEDPELAGRRPGGEAGAFVVGHAGSHVTSELAHPTGPPGRHVGHGAAAQNGCPTRKPNSGSTICE